MGQKFVPLSYSTSGNTLTVQAPAAPALAPPGDYMVFIVNSSGVPSVASMLHIASAAATAPAAPTGVSATAGNAQATVSWTAPNNGGSPITSYTITPYAGTAAQTPTTVTGTPPATTATVTGLTNGTAYTFTVTATNGVGTGPASAASNSVTPRPQSRPPSSNRSRPTGPAPTTRAVTAGAPITAGNRLVVEVGVWAARTRRRRRSPTRQATSTPRSCTSPPPMVRNSPCGRAL